MAAGAWAQTFSDWCNKQIGVEMWDGSFDIEGRPNYASAVVLPCRIESKVRMVRDTTGEERASNTTIYVLGGPLDPHDRITMPLDFRGPSQPPVINVSNLDDIDTFSHSEVYL